MAEIPMIAEVVIHLGSEWRDVLYYFIGAFMGIAVGYAFGIDKK